MQSATADSDRRSADDVVEVAGATGRRQSRRPRATLALTLAMVVVLGICSRPAYRYWHDRRTAFYKMACQEAVQAESWNVLHTVASGWLDWDKHNDDARMYRAEAAQKLGRIDEAVELLGRVADDYPGALQALAVRGDILFSDLNRPYQAVENWERMLRLNARADVARQRLIYFYAMTLQRDQMLAQIRQSMEMGCEPPEAYTYFLLAYEVNFSDGLSILRKWTPHYPEDETLEVARAIYVAKYSPNSSVAMFGTSSVAPGDHSLIDGCLEKYPANLEVLSFHLDEAIYLGDEERVRALLSRCPKAAETDGRFWRYRGWYLAAQNRHGEAADALQRAIEIHPVDWRSRWMLGGVLRRVNRQSEAGRQSRISMLGKDLHKDLFEKPNARALDASLVSRIGEYLELVGPDYARDAFRRRLSDDSL